MSTATGWAPSVREKIRESKKGRASRLIMLRIISLFVGLGFSPSYRYLAKRMGMKLGLTEHHVQILRRQGFLTPSGPLELTDLGFTYIKRLPHSKSIQLPPNLGGQRVPLPGSGGHRDKGVGPRSKYLVEHAPE